MSETLSIHEAALKLRRLHTLLVLGRRSNTLALAIRKALEVLAEWPQSLPFASLFEKKPPKIVFAGYGPKFIKLTQELLNTGDMAMLVELQAHERSFFCELCELPGIGETGARRMFFDKMIETFEDLRVACANGVLKTIPSFGDSRIRVVEAWIQQRQRTPNIAPSDVVVAPFEALQLASRDGADQFSEHQTIINDEVVDFSEEEIFGNELDDALMEDLAALPELSFSEAKKACCNYTPDANDDFDVIQEDERVQRVSYFDASHVSQIDLEFSRNDTRAASKNASRAMIGPRFQALAVAAISGVLPPALLARMMARSRLWLLEPQHSVLLVGHSFVSLEDCVRAELRDAANGWNLVCAPDIEHCPKGAFDRILLDPLDTLDLTPAQLSTCLKKLSLNGSLTMALADLEHISPLAPQMSTNVLFKDVSSLHFVVACESVDFMTICVISRRTVDVSAQ